MIATDMIYMLESAGAEMAGPVGRVEAALALIARRPRALIAPCWIWTCTAVRPTRSSTL